MISIFIIFMLYILFIFLTPNNNVRHCVLLLVLTTGELCSCIDLNFNVYSLYDGPPATRAAADWTTAATEQLNNMSRSQAHFS